MRIRRRYSLLRGRGAVAIGFAISLLVGFFAGASLSPTFARDDASSTPPALGAATADLTTGDFTFAPVVKAALPAVVNISTAKVVRSDVDPSPLFRDPLFRDFFGDRWDWQFRVPRERRERSLGSGVIVSPEGYILTNNHVVEGAEEIRISLADGRELPARPVGTDPRTDIAVLKVDDGNDLPTLSMGDSTSVEVGDIVLAIGNPFGVGQTVTMGIVGAVGRGNLGIVDYEDFIQTDASINPGNSGGALINARGELIGINTAIVARGAQGNQGVGFAVPIAMARDVMDQLLDKGLVTRGWLGVSIQEVSPALGRGFGLDEPRGALVAEVVPDGPAARAGLEPGDVIVAVDGDPVKDTRSLRLRIASAAPGSEVGIRVVRDGKERSFTVRLETLPDEIGNRGTDDARRGGAIEEIDVRELTPEIRRELGLPAEISGVVVAGVTRGGSAEASGLMRGDVIASIGREPVRSVQEFRRAIEKAPADEVLLRVYRRGSSLYLVWKRS